MISLETSDKILLGSVLLSAIAGAILVIIGFVIRFGNGFGEFVNYAVKDDDFLELNRLNLIFGLFTAAGIVLVLAFFVAVFAVFRRHRLLLKMYCGLIALMIIAQLVCGLLAFTYADDVNRLASDEALYHSLNKTMARFTAAGSKTAPGDDETQFWLHTQKTFDCCGVFSSADWAVFAGDENLLHAYNCFTPNYAKGCEKTMRNRISGDAQYIGAAALGVLVAEIVAAFMSGWRSSTMNSL